MTDTALSAEEISFLFTQEDGYRFARWGRPIAPVIFGVDDETLTHMKSAIATTIGVTGQAMAETDPELGSNFMWFMVSDWTELLAVPNLDKLVPGLDRVIERLQGRAATSFRHFGFDAEGAITLCVNFIRISGATADMSVQNLTTGECFRSLLLFANQAFAENSPTAVIAENNLCIVKPNFAAMLRAAYDPGLPNTADDPSHALRIAARANLLLSEITQ